VFRKRDGEKSNDLYQRTGLIGKGIGVKMFFGILAIIVSIIGATLLWPINRWVVRNGGRAEVYGFWISLSGAVISGAFCFGLGQLPRQPGMWVVGAGGGLAFAIGYCMIIMYCLRIGPVGPTTAMNNMGLVWPVAVGIFWLKLHSLNLWGYSGLGLVVAALICFGLTSGKKGEGSRSQPVTMQWVMWASIGWIFSGISMTCQMLNGVYFSKLPFAFVFAFNFCAAIILAPLALRKRSTLKEIVPGMIYGTIAVFLLVATLVSLRYFGPEIIYPFTVAIPIILVLLLERFVYKEHLARSALVACGLSISGLVLLTLGQK
jgi:drug/metabolite transporter (DMT)-like permease